MGWTAFYLAWVGAVLWPLLLLFALWRGVRKGRGPGPLGWSFVLIVSAFWILGIRAFLWEPETLAVRRVEIVSSAWTGGPLRIGIISDTHMGAPHMSVGRLNDIVRQMNAERPDVVVLLGDFAGGHEPAARRSKGEQATIMSGLPPLKGLQAPLGVYAVLGNHDWWYDGPAIEQGLKAQGITVLENSRARVERPEGAFWVAGLADYDSLRAKPSYSEALGDFESEEPVIVLSHWPDVFAAAPERPALTIAGHSHCGQVNLPVAGRLVHASSGSERWPCGLYDMRGRKLYVTGGVGVSIVPARFLQPPEIAVATLRSDD